MFFNVLKLVKNIDKKRKKNNKKKNAEIYIFNVNKKKIGGLFFLIPMVYLSRWKIAIFTIKKTCKKGV